jgi:hypothetical protein
MNRPICCFISTLIATSAALLAADGQLIPALSLTPQASISTVPHNGDVNPYGVVFVPSGFPSDGLIKPGDILVANFNNSANLQGTGTTIVSVTPQSTMPSLFFQGASGLGFTTALGVLKNGFVLVGNTPSPTGTCTQTGHVESGVGQGSLLVINRFGKQVANLTSAAFLNGPWDLTVNDFGDVAQVFISDVLSGTVVRLDLVVPPANATKAPNMVALVTQMGSGYAHSCNAAALVTGPTGLALDPERGVLYVASTQDNAIYAIDNAVLGFGSAGKGRLVYEDNKHLRGPVGLMLAPNGDLVTTNGDAVNGDPNFPSELVEFTINGKFVAEKQVDPNQGAAFGLAIAPAGNSFLFATVDDAINVLDIWTVKL